MGIGPSWYVGGEGGGGGQKRTGIKTPKQFIVQPERKGFN
jgi:hypothetical protein